MKKLTLSVVIPTFGRRQELLDTVADLMRQTRLPDEIVVSDQNQPPLPEVDAGLASFPLVKHVRNDVPGISANYNRCLREATGDIVLYLDDDVKLDPRLLEVHLAAYAADPSLGGVAGRVEQPSGDLDPARIREVGKYHRWSGRSVANFNATRATEVDIAPGGNMSFPRHILLQAGGLDRGFDGNGYYLETDLALRVRKLGYKIVFEPAATLKHLMAPAGGARIRDKSLHTYYFAKNGIRLYRRHAHRLGRPLFYLRLAAYVLAKAAYNGNPRIFLRGLRGIFDGARVSTEMQGL